MQASRKDLADPDGPPLFFFFLKIFSYYRNFLRFPTAHMCQNSRHLVSSRCPFASRTSRKRDQFRLPCRINVHQETAQLAELTQSNGEVTLSASVPAAQDLWRRPALVK